MRKRKSLQVVFLSLLMCFSVMLAVLTLNVKKSVAEGLFTTSEDVMLQSDYAIDEKFGLEETRKGVLLSTATSGAKVDIVNEMVGTFEMDFRVFSQNAFNEKEAYSTVETATEVKNTALELKAFTLKFIDTENGNAFDVVINGGSPMNYATPQASVRVHDRQYGLYYYTWYKKSQETMYENSGNTTQANSIGRYTSLYGSSFTNVAYTSRTVLADNVCSNIICFDPLSMQIYAKNDSGAVTMIWDLASGELDGQVSDTLPVFEKYKVSLEFTEVTNGRTANMVVYSLNGQELGGETLQNTVGPNVFAKYEKNVITGEKLALVKPVCADLLGNEAKNVAVSARINGEKIAVYKANGEVCDDYEDGCYVIPNKEGTMTLSYVASDMECVGREFNVNLNVYDFEPKVEYILDGVVEDGDYGVGTVLNLPKAVAKSSLFKSEPEVFVAVCKNGSVVSGYEKISLPSKVTFEQEGDYTVEYYCEGVNSKSVYNFVIVDELPTFYYENEVQRASVVGETYEIPKVTATFKGETKTADIKMIYPDGSAYANYTMDFAVAGVYTLEYSVEFNGVSHVKTYDITVKDKYYGFTCSAQGTVTFGASNPNLAIQSGMLIQTDSEANTWTYDKVIDLSHSTKNDALICLLNGIGKFDWCYPPHITLTDAHDPTNYVRILVITGWHQLYQKLRAQAPGQFQKGLDWNDQTTVYIGGNNTTGGGYYISFPLQGDFHPTSSYAQQAVWVSYDAEEKAIYARHSLNSEIGKVIDLDAEYQEVLWEGFTTGEVYLSITNCKGFMVTEVYGTKYSGTHYQDDVAPSIFINTGAYTNGDLPKAVINKGFSVFDTVCVDNLDPDVKLDVDVYFENGNQLNVEDGVFIPKYTGKYTIQYTATDSFNNVKVETVTVEAVKESTISKVDFEIAEMPKTVGSLGKTYKIPQITSKSGSDGVLTEKITVTDPDGEEVAIYRNSFIPEKVGQYVLKYLVSDYVGNGAPNSKENVVLIDVSVSNTPVLSKVEFPQAILSGMDFVAPIVKATDYKTDTNGVEVTVTVSATIDGQPVAVKGNIISPVIESGSADMTIVYSATNSYGTSTDSYTVKVVNPGVGNAFVENYFYTTGGNIDFNALTDVTIGDVKQSGVEIATTESGSSWQFINPLLADNLYVKFILPDISYNNAESMTFRLYDYENRDISISLKIVKNLEDTENSKFSLNGGDYSRIAGSWLNANSLLGFRYLQESLSIIGATGEVAGFVNKTEQGDTFTGFPSGRVWLEMEFGEVSGNGIKILLQTLNNHNFNANAEDMVRPQGSINGYIPQIMGINETLTIPSAVAQDVLAAKASVQISVLKKGIVVAENSVNEAFDYKFTEVGTYTIVYKISDSSGKSLSPSYSVTIVEYEDPELIIGSYEKNGKVGQVYVIPECIVRDNMTKNPTLRVFVVAPDRQMEMLFADESTGEFSFVPNQLGEYIIRFYAYDEYENYVLREIVIEVK